MKTIEKVGKLTGCMLVLTMVVGMSACGKDTQTVIPASVQKEETTDTQPEESPQSELQENEVVGKITTIESNDITLGLMLGGGNETGQTPKLEEGEIPELPQGEMPEKPEKGMPEKLEGFEEPAGDEPEAFEDMAEMTITVSDDTKIFLADGNIGSIKDLKIDDMVTVLTEDEKLISITVLSL